ncbi:MAG: AsmA-like C-terminal region-containing protein [Verrucomicrobiota bacterium]
MKKLFIGLVVLIFIAVVALGGALFWLQSYVNSDDFVRQIEGQASKAVGAPVSIDSIGLSLEGLEANQVMIPNAKPFEADHFLKLGQASISIVWKSLFADSVEVTEIQLRQPNLRIYQGNDGGLLLPFAESSSTAASGTAESSAEEKASGLSIALLNLTEGTIELRDSEGEMLVTANGLSVQTNYNAAPSGAVAGSGKVIVDQLLLAGGIKVTQLSSPLELIGNQIQLTAIQGQAYEGSVNGTATVELAENEGESGAYACDLNVADASLAALTASNEKPMQGVVALEADIAGKLDDPKEGKGKGTLLVTDLAVPGVDSFKTLGSVLGLDVLSQGKADRLDGEFKIGQQRLTFSKLDLDSKGVDVQLTGTLTFEKMLNLSGQAVIEAGASSLFNDLAGDLLDNERQKPRSIPLRITGPIDAPKIDAETGAILQDLKRGLMNRFLNPSSEDGGVTPSEGAEEAAPSNPGAILNRLFN